MKVNFGLHEDIAQGLVFVDGITRCGKSIFSGVISSLEDMEHIQFTSLLEHIVPAVGLGAMDINLANSLLRLYFNELAYNLQLSRNVNFRSSDQTGIDNYKEPNIYKDRLNVREGDDIAKLLRERRILIPFQTHDLMVDLDVIEKLDINCKIIELYRNPVDNLYSWWDRGWGDRFTDDPRAFTLSILHNDSLLPWYNAGFEEQFLKFNPYEKCLYTGMSLIKESIKKHKSAKKPENILPILFEEMVQRPNPQLKRIEGFLKTKKSKFTDNFIFDANCPRKLDLKVHEHKISVFKNNVNSSLFEELIYLNEYYEKERYGICFD
jgi:hypothetical protein